MGEIAKIIIADELSKQLWGDAKPQGEPRLSAEASHSASKFFVQAQKLAFAVGALWGRGAMANEAACMYWCRLAGCLIEAGDRSVDNYDRFEARLPHVFGKIEPRDLESFRAVCFALRLSERSVRSSSPRAVGVRFRVEAGGLQGRLRQSQRGSGALDRPRRRAHGPPAQSHAGRFCKWLTKRGFQWGARAMEQYAIGTGMGGRFQLGPHGADAALEGAVEGLAEILAAGAKIGVFPTPMMAATFYANLHARLGDMVADAGADIASIDLPAALERHWKGARIYASNAAKVESERSVCLGRARAKWEGAQMRRDCPEPAPQRSPAKSL